MSKKIHFISGLPRSGSTLLCNLLAQNPEVHATATSGLHEIGYIARQFFQTDEFKSMNPLEGKQLYTDFVRGGCENAYNNITNRPIVVDKGRSWIGHLDQLFQTFPDAKVIVPVRDIRGILCSMELKWQQHPQVFNGAEQKSALNWTTVDKRVNGWLSNPPVGVAIERLHEAHRRFGDKLCYVHFEQLTTDPQKAMNKIWDYLDIEFDKHDFNNVNQYTTEHEIGFPYGDHSIKTKVSPVNHQWNDILGTQLSEGIRQKFEWINKL